MTKYRCNSCGSTYSDQSVENGAIYEYYHTCPPKVKDQRDENKADGKIKAEGKGRTKIDV